MQMIKRLLNAQQVAERLNVPKGTVYNWLSQGKLPGIRVFGALRFDPDDIEKLIEEGRTRGQERKADQAA
jgi:excisionase family DNA binding protein